MTETADAIVVGAGLNGAAVGWSLINRGLGKVLILDSGLAASGASGNAVGLLRTHYDNGPETKLACLSMKRFRDWQSYVGAECGFTRTGFLRLLTQDEMANAAANVELQQEYGEEVSILPPDQVREVAPELVTSDIAGAVYEPDSGTADNRLAATTLLQRACAAPSGLRPLTPVLGIDVCREQVTGVVTPQGVISSPLVILAAGTGSRAIAATCGVEIPLEDREITFAEIVTRRPKLVNMTWMDPISDSWLAVRTPSSAMINIPTIDRGEREPTDNEIAVGIQRVSSRLAISIDFVVAGIHRNTDSFTPDGKPVIGGFAAPNGLYVTAGASGKGHKVAPAAADALADLIVDGRSDQVDLHPFRPSRFAEGGTNWGETQYETSAIGT